MNMPTQKELDTIAARAQEVKELLVDCGYPYFIKEEQGRLPKLVIGFTLETATYFSIGYNRIYFVETRDPEDKRLFDSLERNLACAKLKYELPNFDIV